MACSRFLDLPDASAGEADVIVLPLPYEGTVSFGRGTAQAPDAIWRASAQIELWDEEMGFELDSLAYHTAPAAAPQPGESPDAYLARVFEQAAAFRTMRGLAVGIGGEHSLTPALVAAAVERPDDLSGLTVVQFDAHADLRDAYEGTPHNHACAMRRLVERGARLVAVGIRSADHDEAAFARSCDLVRTFPARSLQNDPDCLSVLLELFGNLRGPVYLTIDVDVLEVSLCPATGTPQPGGLGWWQTLAYLRRLLHDNRRIDLIGCDVVETVPQPGTLVNETVAAALVAKILAYRFTAPSAASRP